MHEPGFIGTRSRNLVATTLFLAAGILCGPPAAAERLYIPVRGVNTHTAVGFELNAVPEMHMNWVRFDISWPTVQPARGVWEWGWVDAAVEGARSRGLKILAILDYTPDWACSLSSPVGGPTCVPEDVGEWQAFVAAVTTRYDGVVDAYAIWNEPDLSQFWSGDSWAYVHQILVPAAQVIRQNSPSALIVGPELSGSSSPTIPAESFYTEIDRASAGGYIDVVGQHVYEDWASGPDGILQRFFDGNMWHHSLLYDIDRSSLAGKPVWITETGFETGGWAGTGYSVLRLFELFGPRTRVTGFFDYDLRDSPGSQRGLLTLAGTFKTGATRLATSMPCDDWNPAPPLISDGFDYLWSGNASTDFRWLYPNGGQSIANGRLVNQVQSFAAKVRDVAATDFEVATTIQMTNDMGSGWNWMGLLGRTTTAADTFQQSGYLALVRSNGRVDLWSPATGTLAYVQTAVDPKAEPVRLSLRCVGSDISVALNGTTVLSVSDWTYTSGYFGIQDYSRGRHDDVVAIRLPPAQ
jgi:hypothetical protein